MKDTRGLPCAVEREADGCVRCRYSQNAHKTLTKFCERHRKSSEAIRQIFIKKILDFRELIPFLRGNKRREMCVFM
jgi:hypothetical protein